MKKYKVMDSLGETIGFIESTDTESQVLLEAKKLYSWDNPTLKLIG